MKVGVPPQREGTLLRFDAGRQDGRALLDGRGWLDRRDWAPDMGLDGDARSAAPKE
jgi:hypothetical protein